VDIFHYKWESKRGEDKEGMQLETTLTVALFAIEWVQKFALLLAFLAFQVEEIGIIEQILQIA
jgi:hypothetical protein